MKKNLDIDTLCLKIILGEREDALVMKEFVDNLFCIAREIDKRRLTFFTPEAYEPEAYEDFVKDLCKGYPYSDFLLKNCEGVACDLFEEAEEDVRRDFEEWMQAAYHRAKSEYESDMKKYRIKKFGKDC